MKHLKLVAALAMPAMFAACTSEDLYSEGNNTPQQMEEVVGYKLVSNGASFQVVGAESRVSAGTGNFHSTDLIGLGWVLNKNAAEEQSVSKLPTQDRLYANHMFAYEEEGGFKTKGNIYEGWYFSYYPWAYEKQMSPKTFIVNPDQKSKSADDRVSQRLHISHLQFIDDENVNQTNGELQLSYQVEKALNILNVKTTVAKGSAFEAKESEGLDDWAIRSITISTGDDSKKIFAEKLNLKATKLPVYNAVLDNDEEKTVAEENKEALLNALYDVTDSDPALVKADLKSEIKTYIGERKAAVAEDGTTTTTQDVVYKISEPTKLYTLLAPAKAELELSKFNITINLDNGHFEVKYIDPETLERELTKAEETNNAAIEKLVNAFAGEVEAPENEATTLTRLQEGAMGIDVVLYDDIFVTDFKHISNETEWVKAVELVETLGRKTEDFYIDGTIELTAGVDKAITSEGKLYMPSTCQITVHSAACGHDQNQVDNFLRLKGTLNEWPTNLTSNVYFEVAEGAVWNNAHNNNQVSPVVNYGTINIPTVAGATKEEPTTMGNNVTNYGLMTVGKYAEVSNVNNLGRIEIVWSSYVYVNRNEGVIAYEVTTEDVNKPKRIQILTATQTDKEQKKLASVNTLIFGKDITIDLTKAIAANGPDVDDNAYGEFIESEGSEADEYDYGDLSNVNFEINGGTVYSTSEKRQIEVKNVTMNGGSINNIQINGKLTIEGGANDVNLNDSKLINNLEIKGGNSTVYATVINNSVTAKGENAIHADKIDGSLTVEGKHHEIVVTEITNDVVVSDNATISNSTIKGNVEIKSGATGMENVVINGKLTNKATVKAFNLYVGGEFTNNGTAELRSNNTIKIATLTNNGTLTSNNDINVTNVNLNPGSWTTLDSDPNVIGYDKVIYYTGTCYNKDMTLQGRVAQYGEQVLLAAIEAAENGAIVTLSTDVVLSEALVITKDITIDLNGKTITAGLFTENGGTMSEGNTDSYGFWVKNGGKLTINGNGTVITQPCTYSIAVWADGGEVIINGGYYENAGEGSDLIYAKNAGKVIINNGEFKACKKQDGVPGTNEEYSALNLKDNSNSQIIVNGGRFYKFDPSNNQSENPQENFVAEGKTVTTDGDWFVVE